MPITRQHIVKSRKRVKKLAPVVVVTNTFSPIEETAFPEKLQKAKEILSKTKFLPR